MAYSRRWYQRNKAKKQASNDRWRLANPDKWNQLQKIGMRRIRARRSKVRGASPKRRRGWSDDQYQYETMLHNLGLGVFTGEKRQEVGGDKALAAAERIEAENWQGSPPE